MPLTVHVLPQLQDNYSYVLAWGPQTERAAVVDPAEADRVSEFLLERRLNLEALLVTHHHGDHVAGIEELLRGRSVPVYCSASDLDRVPGATKGLRQGETIRLQGLVITALHVPGHTRGHMAYLCEGRLFCGDALFLGGCGRLFEGTAEELFHSLYERILPLPEGTKLYPGHEYTMECRAFCADVEKDNPRLLECLEEARLLRSRGAPTVPGTLKTEKETNLFLRCQDPRVIRAVRERAPHLGRDPDPIAIFSTLRSWKDVFRFPGH